MKCTVVKHVIIIYITHKNDADLKKNVARYYNPYFLLLVFLNLLIAIFIVNNFLTWCKKCNFFNKFLYYFCLLDKLLHVFFLYLNVLQVEFLFHTFNILVKINILLFIFHLIIANKFTEKYLFDVGT